MNPILDRLVWASVTGGVAILAALVACRVHFISPLTKVWICRFAYGKLLASLVTTAAIPIVLHVSAGVRANGSDPLQYWLGIWLTSIWLCGVGVVATHYGKGFRQARQIVDSAQLATLFEHRLVADVASDAGVRKQFPVLRSSVVSHPCVLGVYGPALILPPDFQLERDSHVLSHEIHHLKHRDLAWSKCYAVFLAVFWFHPLVWALEKEVRLWQEVAADKKAAAKTRVRPVDQAESILHAVTRSGFSDTQISGSLGVVGNAETVCRRLTALYQRGYSIPMTLVAMILVGFSAIPCQPVAAESERIDHSTSQDEIIYEPVVPHRDGTRMASLVVPVK